jgi:hypothetical protein
MSYWFRPKYYGYGATPTNWKGWLATLIFVSGLVALAKAALPPILHVALILLAVALFTWIAWKKTDGPWRWRWGSPRERNQGT